MSGLSGPTERTSKAKTSAAQRTADVRTKVAEARETRTITRKPEIYVAPVQNVPNAVAPPTTTTVVVPTKPTSTDRISEAKTRIANAKAEADSRKAEREKEQAARKDERDAERVMREKEQAERRAATQAKIAEMKAKQDAQRAEHGARRKTAIKTGPTTVTIKPVDTPVVPTTTPNVVPPVTQTTIVAPITADETMPVVDSGLTDYSPQQVEEEQFYESADSGSAEYPEFAFQDDNGIMVYYDDNGEYIYFDDAGDAQYYVAGETESTSAEDSSYPPLAFVDSKGVQVYYDDNGDTIYLDSAGEPQYYEGSEAEEVDGDFVYDGLAKSGGVRGWERTDEDSNKPFQYGLGTFYIPYIDDAKKKRDEESKRIIKTPEIKLSDFGIKGGNFFEDIIVKMAQKKVNEKVADTTQGWDKQLRKTFGFGKLMKMSEYQARLRAEEQGRVNAAQNAVKLAEEMTATRLLNQYPASVNYEAQPVQRTKTSVKMPGVTVAQCSCPQVKRKAATRQMTMTEIRKTLLLE